MSAIACMGGWCWVREHCALYVQPAEGAVISERRCAKGKEMPVLILRPEPAANRPRFSEALRYAMEAA